MFLTSLCETNNFKQESVNFADIARLIVDEIKQLETTGINIGGNSVKGTLIHVTADNLGANGALGFVESFNSYFCRACEISKKDSQQSVKEAQSLLRSKESYSKCVQVAVDCNAKGKKIDYKITKGVKRECYFNELGSYHTVNNITFDLMHDILEGTGPFLLNTIFSHFIQTKKIKQEEIVMKIRDFNYGILNKRNKPSLINFEKANLGQNSSQMHCLLLHIPFIFADFREKFENDWLVIECFLKAMSIICSKSITNADVDTLETLIQLHLTLLIEKFHINLIPKHHLLTHYPNAIRKMGPPIHFWMMRFESKHQYFTRIAKNTKNFINLCKTLSKKHQEMICQQNFALDTMDRSKTVKKIIRIPTFNTYKTRVARHFGENVISSLDILNFAIFNSSEYREGLFIIASKIVYDIILIFCTEKQVHIFCRPFRVKRIDSFLNSIEIECEPENVDNFEIFDVSKLASSKTYEKKISNGKKFIICDTLDVSNVLKLILP